MKEVLLSSAVSSFIVCLPRLIRRFWLDISEIPMPFEAIKTPFPLVLLVKRRLVRSTFLTHLIRGRQPESVHADHSSL